MADWTEILEGISGGLSGIPKGLTAGLAPFDLWENERTKYLASDRNEILLRDLSQTQAALENPALDYYGNLATAKNTGNRLSTTKGESDIFGLQRNLALQEYLSDPNGAFQQGVVQAGLTPGTPEYRRWLAEAISMYDPAGGVKSYDSFGVPQIEQRNLNEQATLMYAQNWIRKNGPDPNAELVRNSDGTVSILSEGQMYPVPGGLMPKIAAMMNGPDAAIRQGIQSESQVQRVNAEVYRAMTSGQITPSVAFNYYKEQGVSLRRDLTSLETEARRIQAAPNFSMMTPEEQQAALGPVIQQIEATRQRLRTNELYAAQVAKSGQVQQGGATPRGPAPVGGTTVTTRPPPGGAAARAAGAAAAPSTGALMGPPRPQDMPPTREAQGKIRGADPLLDFLTGIGVL